MSDPATAPEATQHATHTQPTRNNRPPFLPLLHPNDFCKARYSHADKRCYTAHMMDVFLDDRHPFVSAYKEFRLATMDYLYEHHRDDHAQNAEQRCAGWNAVAQKLGYKQIPPAEYETWLNSLAAESL